MEEIGEKILLLAGLLGIGGACTVLAEMLCRSLGLDRVAAKPEEYDDADAQAMYEDLAREIEREAAAIAKRCGAEP